MPLIPDVAVIAREATATPLYSDSRKPGKNNCKNSPVEKFRQSSHHCKFCRGHAEIFVLVCAFKSSCAAPEICNLNHLKLRLLNENFVFSFMNRLTQTG